MSKSRNFLSKLTIISLLCLVTIASSTALFNSNVVTYAIYGTNDVNTSNGMVSSNPNAQSSNSNSMMQNNKGSNMMSMGNSAMNMMSNSSMMSNPGMNNSSMNNNMMNNNMMGVNTTKDTFELTKIVGNKLTLLKNDKTQEIDASGDIKITKNAVTAKVSDLKPKDQITITKDANGDLISIEAVGREVFDTSYYVVPTIIGLVLLGLVGYLIYRQMNKGHIKTQATKIQ